MTPVVDWLLSDGAPGIPQDHLPRRYEGPAPHRQHRLGCAPDQCGLLDLPGSGDRLILWLVPHPTQPLCWQDTVGGLTAATLIWRRGTIDERRGSHETVGEGSAVLVTPAGLRALANGTVILRVHRIVRTAGGPTRSRQVSTGELPPLEVNVSA